MTSNLVLTLQTASSKTPTFLVVDSLQRKVVRALRRLILPTVARSAVIEPDVPIGRLLESGKSTATSRRDWEKNLSLRGQCRVKGFEKNILVVVNRYIILYWVNLLFQEPTATIAAHSVLKARTVPVEGLHAFPAPA